MIESTVLVAIIIGVTEAVKRTGQLPSKYAAIFAIFIGVIVMLFSGGDVVTNIFEGVIAGLTSAGLYSGGKAVATK